MPLLYFMGKGRGDAFFTGEIEMTIRSRRDRCRTVWRLLCFWGSEAECVILPPKNRILSHFLGPECGEFNVESGGWLGPTPPERACSRKFSVGSDSGRMASAWINDNGGLDAFCVVGGLDNDTAGSSALY